MCRGLRVTRQGCHARRAREPSVRARRREDPAEKAERIHTDSRGTYGSPRVHQQLYHEGERCSVNTVASVMHENGIRAGKAQRFRPRTTGSDHDPPIAPNRLEGEFTADRPNARGVADITCLPTRNGFCDLAVVMELYSRRIIGRHVAEPMRAELVCAALRMAIVHRRPPAGLIFHSDRGVQYAAERFRTPLEAHGMLRSMSRKGDCYDNAPMESRMGTLKRELVGGERFANAAEARSAGFEFVAVFYNCQRLHSTLAYLTPEAFECEALRRTDRHGTAPAAQVDPLGQVLNTGV
jgi:transposase InsO family protein